MTEKIDIKTQEMRDAVKKLIEKKEGWKITEDIYSFDAQKRTKDWGLDECLTPKYHSYNEKTPYWLGHTGRTRGLESKEFKTLQELLNHMEKIIDWLEDGYKKGLFCGEGEEK